MFAHFSVLDWRRNSRSMLFCFFNSCIFRTRSASESFRFIVKSSDSLLDDDGDDGGRGGFRNVNDSSTCVWLTSGITAVCRRLGNDTLTSAVTTSPLYSFVLFSLFSSKSGVDVHEIGRLRRGAVFLSDENQTYAIYDADQKENGNIIKSLRASLSAVADKFDVDVQLRSFGFSDCALIGQRQKRNEPKKLLLLLKIEPILIRDEQKRLKTFAKKQWAQLGSTFITDLNAFKVSLGVCVCYRVRDGSVRLGDEAAISSPLFVP